MQSSASILHLDDDPLLTRIVATALENAGFHCRALHQADELFQEVEHGHYDILLLDLDMPNADGLEVLRRVRKLDPYLSVIILTGHVSLSVVMESRHLGADYCFFKPVVDFEPLIAALRDAIVQREHWQTLSTKIKQAENQAERVEREQAAADAEEFAGNLPWQVPSEYPEDQGTLHLPDSAGEMAIRDAEAFCDFLLNRGAVSADDLQNAMALLKAQTPKIGHLALQSRVLTINEVMSVLQRQAQTNELFGQAAINSGYINQEQLEMLLEPQAESVPSLSETLVALGLTTEEEMQNFLRDYHLLRIQGKSAAVHEHPR